MPFYQKPIRISLFPPQDYTSSDRSDSKLHAGLPLAGPVPLPSHMRHDDPLMQFRYSNDYSDPTYSDPYFKVGFRNS